MSATTGASLTDETVKVATSEAYSRPGSVAVKVIVSEPFQVGDGGVMVATRFTSIETVSSYCRVGPGDLVVGRCRHR